MPRPHLKKLVVHLTLTARPFWRAALPPAAILLTFGLIFAWKEPTYLITGLILQLLGICLVLVAINDSLAALGRRRLWPSIVDWLTTLRLYLGLIPPTTVQLEGTTHGGTVRMTGNPLHFIVSPADTVESRLKALEHNFTSLRQQLDQSTTAINARLDSAATELGRVRSEHQETIATMKALIEKVTIDDSRWDIVGVAWVFVGTILAAISSIVAAIHASAA
jgi:hypothetical protein